jgi:hypothetical protein
LQACVVVVLVAVPSLRRRRSAVTVGVLSDPLERRAGDRASTIGAMWKGLETVTRPDRGSRAAGVTWSAPQASRRTTGTIGTAMFREETVEDASWGCSCSFLCVSLSNFTRNRSIADLSARWAARMGVGMAGGVGTKSHSDPNASTRIVHRDLSKSAEFFVNRPPLD